MDDIAAFISVLSRDPGMAVGFLLILAGLSLGYLVLKPQKKEMKQDLRYADRSHKNAHLIKRTRAAQSYVSRSVPLTASKPRASTISLPVIVPRKAPAFFDKEAMNEAALLYLKSAGAKGRKYKNILKHVADTLSVKVSDDLNDALRNDCLHHENNRAALRHDRQKNVWVYLADSGQQKTSHKKFG